MNTVSKNVNRRSDLMLTQNDYQRLKAFSGPGGLAEQLKSARLFSQTEIAKDVVTMNSRVRLKDLATNREVEVTVTYPQDANPRERRLSVFSEIGMALLGRKEGDIVSWRVPAGTGRFHIVKVTYQPEAAGDYSL